MKLNLSDFKVYPVVLFVAFITAMFIPFKLIKHDLNLEQILYACYWVFGTYGGFTAIATVFKTASLPQDQIFTITYERMVQLMILSWVFFFEIVIFYFIGKPLGINYPISLAFTGACGMTGVYAAGKKANVAAKVHDGSNHNLSIGK